MGRDVGRQIRLGVSGPRRAFRRQAQPLNRSVSPTFARDQIGEIAAALAAQVLATDMLSRRQGLRGLIDLKPAHRRYREASARQRCLEQCRQLADTLRNPSALVDEGQASRPRPLRRRNGVRGCCRRRSGRLTLQHHMRLRETQCCPIVVLHPISCNGFIRYRLMSTCYVPGTFDVLSKAQALSKPTRSGKWGWPYVAVRPGSRFPSLPLTSFCRR